MFSKITNPKIGLYNKDNITYMSIDATAHCSIENKINNSTEVQISIPQIDLSQAILEVTNDYYFDLVEGSKYREECLIKFPIIPYKENEYVFFTFKEKAKEMTKEEIEKELGYKIKIVSN